MIGVTLILIGVSKLIYDAVKEETTAKGRLTETAKYLTGGLSSKVTNLNNKFNNDTKEINNYEHEEY